MPLPLAVWVSKPVPSRSFVAIYTISHSALVTVKSGSDELIKNSEISKVPYAPSITYSYGVVQQPG